MADDATKPDGEGLETIPATGEEPLANEVDPFEGVGVEPPAGEPEPGPLDQGGQRFNQVWARMKQAEAASDEVKIQNARLQERLTALEQTPRSTVTPNATSIATLTENDLQVAIDSGDSKEVARVTVGIARQAGITEARKTAQQTDAKTQYRDQLVRATAEIKKYVDVAPSIATKDHKDWKSVEAAYFDDVANFGAPKDPRTELRALRTVFGPVDRFKARVDAAKRLPDHHTEVGGGTGVEIPSTNIPIDTTSTITDLSQVPKRFTNFWDTRGMSKEDQLKEARYLRPSQLARK